MERSHLNRMSSAEFFFFVFRKTSLTYPRTNSKAATQEFVLDKSSYDHHVKSQQ